MVEIFPDLNGFSPGSRHPFIFKGCQLLVKHKKRGLAVFFCLLEAVSVVLDLFGKSKTGFLLAAFLLSAVGFVITVYVCIKERTIAASRIQAERQVGVMEIVFSAVQFIATFLHFISTVFHVKNGYINVSVYPLAFAVIVVVFIFQKDTKFTNSVSSTTNSPPADPVPNFPIEIDLLGSMVDRDNSTSTLRLRPNLASRVAPADHQVNLHEQLQNIESTGFSIGNTHYKAGNSSGLNQLQNSSQEEDLYQEMNERRRKRFQSYRERSSRIRQQNYLDNLMAQVSQLEKDSDQIHIYIYMITHNYLTTEAENSTLRAENSTLRAEFMELNHRLESLNEILGNFESDQRLNKNAYLTAPVGSQVNQPNQLQNVKAESQDSGSSTTSPARTVAQELNDGYDVTEALRVHEQLKVDQLHIEPVNQQVNQQDHLQNIESIGCSRAQEISGTVEAQTWVTPSGSNQLQSSSSEEFSQLVMDENIRSRTDRQRVSRMTKQKQLDDVTVQVAQLKKANDQILTSIDITNRHYLNIEAENSILRAEMEGLVQRLQSLNEILNLINTNNGVFEPDQGLNQIAGNQIAGSFINPMDMFSLNQPIMAAAEMFQY